jgi:hypothetical protein
MSYRSEMKKVIEKYYPKYKVDKVLTPTLRCKGYSNDLYYQINVDLKKKVVIPKVKKINNHISRKYGSNESPEPYYHGESIETIERREGHGFWGNSSSGYITDEQSRNMR